LGPRGRSAEFVTKGAELGAAFDALYIGLVDTSTAGFYPGVANLLRALHARNVQLGALTNAAVAYAEAVRMRAMSCISFRGRAFVA
jgi:phosphoglycolate phosphatase-like HAD superfamily hydrolase